jgi:YGGT family
MQTNEVDQTVVTKEPAAATGQEPSQTNVGQETVRTDSRRVTRSGPGTSEMSRRVIVLLFGLIQILIGARFLLLLINAREANDLVSWILNVSQVFVAPFEGILQTNALHAAAGSVLDYAAIVAFVGWTILELIVIWGVGIFRRESA